MWIPKINPAFLEVKLFLSGKVMDEARHAEVCVKRLWLNGHGPTATGRRPTAFLAPLAQTDDYEQASLLVDVLGEGQILDIFKIVYDLAPDEATRRIVLLSRRDEARHVSYGVARLRHRLETGVGPRGGRADGRSNGSPTGSRPRTSSSCCPRTCRAHSACSETHIGVDGRARARGFPQESNQFRLARLNAAGLPPQRSATSGNSSVSD